MASPHTADPKHVGDTTYRALVSESVALAAVVVHTNKDMGIVLPLVTEADCGFVTKGIRTVCDHEGTGNHRAILLNRSISPTEVVVPGNPSDLSKLPSPLRESLQSYVRGGPELEALLSRQKGAKDDKPKGKKEKQKQQQGDNTAPENERRTLSLVSKSVSLSYRNYTMTELVRKVYDAANVPANTVIPSSFEQVGHIAHLNLLPVQLPFKYAIGQIVMDTNPTVETVVNKTEALSSEFRELALEVIGGDSTRLTAEVKQYGLTFRVPYDKVYWNSRLCEEHERLVGLMKPGDELYDVMAGVGPFAIPAAARGIKAWGNDLNPASVEAMDVNAALNKVELRTSVLDGRVFIAKIRDEILRKVVMKEPARRHFAMNLPALAVTFLDAFTGPEWCQGDIVDRRFVIHCYTFSAATDAKADAVEQVYTHLYGTEDATLQKRDEVIIEDAVIVRDVAPKKLMVCVSFSFTDSAFNPVARSTKDGRCGSSTAKKQRVE